MKFSFTGECIELCRLLRCLCCGRDVQPVVTLTFRDGVAVTFNGDWKMDYFVDHGPYTATVGGFVDKTGKPATEVDAPVWSSSDPTIATVVANTTNPLTAAVTPLKAGTVTIKADFPGSDTTGHGPAYPVTGTMVIQDADTNPVSGVMTIA